MKSHRSKADIIIKNSCIVDGSSNPFYYADIAIEGDKIAYIGDLHDCEAPLVIDAYGKVVTPGFIDCHSHSDATIWSNPECQSTIRQGVTTEIVGNCGMTKPMFNRENRDRSAEDITCIYDGDVSSGAYPRVFDKIRKIGISENTVWLCGHNGLRQIAGIMGPGYTEEQFAIMEKHLHEAMEAGYAGLSTGLEFMPGVNAKNEEIIRLAAVVKEYDGIYASHIRNRDSEIFLAIEEFLDVLRVHKIRGVLSHLNVRLNTNAPENALRKAIARLYEVRDKERLNVLTDMVPVLSGMGQMIGILPPWVTENGWEKAREILLDPEMRKLLRTQCDRYWRFIHKGDWFRVRLQASATFPEVAGKPLTEIAKIWGKDEWDCFFDILAAAKTQKEAELCSMLGQMFSEEDIVDSVIKEPIFMWETDGYTTVDDGLLSSFTRNPQHYKDVVYFFTHHVREKKAISLEKAVSKITSLPATHFRLRGRGQICEGFYADINVFELDKLKINASFENPCVYSEGFDYVIVNGIPVLSEGKHTLMRPGRVLIPQSGR